MYQLRSCLLTDDGSRTEAQSHMNQDYSVTADDFYVEPDPDETLIVYQLDLMILDTTTMAPDKFGSITDGITNGITFIHKFRGVEYELNCQPLKLNSDLILFFESVTYDAWGVGPNLLICQEHIAEHGHLLPLRGADGDRIILRLNDDLSTLVDMRCNAKTRRYDGNLVNFEPSI